MSVGLRALTNAIASNEDVGVHTKMSLNVRHRVVSPACITGIWNWRPNRTALCLRPEW